MIDFVQVGNKISQYRKKACLSQDELADKLFVTRQALSKWENGQAIISIDTLLNLCKIFSVSFEDILCLNTINVIKVDPNNIFENNKREYVINKLINNQIDVNVCEILYQLSNAERLLVIKAIKEKKLKVNLNELKKKLSISEIKYLGGNTYESKKSNH